MLSKNQIKEIQSLQLKKFRDAQRLFIVEGVKTVSELIEQRSSSVQALFATREFLESHSALILKNGITAHEITEAELKKISMQVTPNRALAVVSYFEKTISTINFEKDFSLYLDEVRDPGNFGTLIRLAGWFGIKTIFCSPGSCDFYNSKVIQSTMGAFLRVSVEYIQLNDLIAKQNITHVYGAVLHGQNLYNLRLNNGLIVIGNEANGISEENLELISQQITIPAGAQNNTESLNAAIAGSIIVSEFFRQSKNA